jgi:hypothetical protein
MQNRERHWIVSKKDNSSSKAVVTVSFGFDEKWIIVS